jgi:hypothetical protein
MNQLKGRLEMSVALLKFIDNRRQQTGDANFAIGIERAVIERELRELEQGSPVTSEAPKPEFVRVRRRR